MTYQQIPDPLPIAWNDTAAAISIAANATASGSVTSPGGSASYIVQLTGTWSATLQIQISRDGVNYVNVTSGNITNLATGDAVASGNITVNGVYQMNVAGIAAARVITTAYTSGTIVGATAITPAVGTANVTVSGTTTISGTVPVTTTPTASVAGTLVSPWSAQFAGGGGIATAQTMKSSAGRLYGLSWYSPNSTVCYLQMFFQASPTVGTTTPTWVIPLAPQAFNQVNPPSGLASGVAFTFAVTTTRTGNTAPTTAVDVFGVYC